MPAVREFAERKFLRRRGAQITNAMAVCVQVNALTSLFADRKISHGI